MDNVHVAIRVRPLIQRERHTDAEIYWKTDAQEIAQTDNRGKTLRREYVFDRVFGSSETTDDVYEEIAQPIVNRVMDGFNGTIFAYGQTSSGKTYTMMGDRLSPGIIPRSVHEIFHHIESATNREFLLRMSYMELYNEGLCDLLSSEKKPLQIRENDKTVFVHDLTEEFVSNPHEVLQLLKKGEARRHFGQTDMNERSSRSHTIFRMIVESREIEEHDKSREIEDHDKSIEIAVRVSHLNLVDLAGSERANETKSEGIRLKEACKINQSLHVLAMVINKLSQGADFIPFRDSKLTRILQMSLGGNANTAIVCTVTPASLEQTHSTLQFASRAKTIKNKPKVNEILSKDTMLQRQKEEIQELKRKVSELEQQGELFEVKTRLHEQQEQKIKVLEKMILVSSGSSMAAVPNPAPAKYKRRLTWCPGMMGKPLPLLPLTKGRASEPINQDSAAAPPNSTVQATSPTSVPGEVSSPQGSSSSITSIGSDDFTHTKELDFLDDMSKLDQDMMEEVGFLPPVIPTHSKQSKKRRRAHVHFTLSEIEEQMSASSTIDGDGTKVSTDEPAIVAELQIKITNLEESIVALQEDRHKCQSLSLALEESQNRIDSLRAKTLEQDDLIGSMRAKYERDTSLQQQQQLRFLEEGRAQLEREKMSALRSSEESKEILEKRLTSANAQIQNLEEENRMVTDLSDTLCRSEERVSHLEAQTARESDALNQEVTALKCELETRVNADRIAAEDIAETRREHANLKARLAGQEDTIAAASRQNETLLLRVTELEGEIAGSKEECESLRCLPERLDRTGRQLDEFRQLFREAESNIASLRDDNSHLTEQLKTMQERTEQETRGDAAKIQELEAVIQKKDTDLVVISEQVDELTIEMENQGRQKCSEAKGLTIEGVSREPGADGTVSAGENDSTDGRICDLTRALRAREEEIETLGKFLEEQGQDAEETRAHHVARIAELTKLLESQQRQAMPNGLEDVSRHEQPSLADEIAQDYQARTSQKTETGPSASTQPCEDVEVNTVLLKQIAELQNQRSTLAHDLKVKMEELEELRDFTEMEADVLREQEDNFQEHIKSLQQKLSDQQKVTAELEKKLNGKDKVLEAQYQRDVDELLDKLREKNKKVELLNEEKSALSLSASRAERVIEELRGQGRGSVERMECLPMDQDRVDVGVVEEGVPMESSGVEAGQDGVELRNITAEVEALKGRIAELGASEESLSQRCESLLATIASRDEEIEILNELLQDNRAEKHDNDDDERDSKIAAFAEYVTELEQKLHVANCHPPSGEEEGVEQRSRALVEENRSLSNSLIRAESYCEELKGQLADRKDSLDRRPTVVAESTNDRERLAGLEERVRSLTEENDHISEVLTETDINRKELRHQLDALREKQTEEVHAEGQLELLRQGILAKTQDCERMSDALERSEGFCAELKQNLVDLEERSIHSDQLTNATVSDYENRLAMLRQEFQAAQEEKENICDSLKQQVQVLEATREERNRMVDGTISELEKQLETLKEQLQAAKEENENILKALTGSESICEDLKQKLMNLEDAFGNQHKEMVDATISDYENQLATLRQQLQATKEENEDILSSLNRSESMCKDLDRRNRSLEDSIERNLQSGDGLVDTASADYEIQLERLRSQLQDSREENEAMSNSLNASENLCEGLKLQIKDLEVNLEERNRRSKELVNNASAVYENQLETLTTQLRDSQEENSCLCNNLRESEHVCEDLKLQIKNLEISLEERSIHTKESVDGTILKYEDQLETLRHQLQATKEENDYISNSLRGSESSCEELKHQIQNLVAGLEEKNLQSKVLLDNTSADFENQLDILRRQLQDSQEENSCTCNNLRESETVCEGLNLEIKNLQASLEERNRHNKEMLDDKFLEYENRLETLRQQLKATTEEYESSADFCDDLQQQVRDLEGTIEKGKDYIGATVSEYEEQLALLSQELQVMTQRNKELSESLTRAETYGQELDKIREDASQEGDEILNQMSARCSDYEMKMAEMGKEIAALTERNSVLAEEVETSKTDCKELGGSLQDFERQRCENDQKITILTEDKNRIQDQLDQTVKELERISTIRDTLSNDNDRLRETCDRSKEEHDVEMRQCQEMEKTQNDDKARLELSLQELTKKFEKKTVIFKRLSNANDRLREVCDELEEKYEAEVKQHRQAKEMIADIEVGRVRLKELEEKNVSVKEIAQDCKYKLAEKNLRINELETDQLRGMDHLEKKIQSLREEIHYQENRVQQYKRENEKLRSQPVQKVAPTSSVPDRAPEDAKCYGIIEKCTVLAMKSEKDKMSKVLEKTKQELGYKDLKYHEAISQKTQAENEARHWKEKARMLANHLKRLPEDPPPTTTNQSTTALPLKDCNKIPASEQPPLAKKSRLHCQADSNGEAKLPAVRSSTVAQTKNSQAATEESGNQAEEPMQCATQ